MSYYVPLHVHSAGGSLLDAISKPKDIVKRCQEIGSPACAITDHASISNAVTLYKEFKDSKLKLIQGIELNVCEVNLHDPEHRQYYHLLLLAKNLQGWKQLIKIVSFSNHPDNFYYKPRVTLNDLKEFADGNLICISGHYGSLFTKCMFDESGVKSTAMDESLALATTLQEIFGVGNFFLEIQLIDKENLPEVEIIADILRSVSKKTGIPCVATPDAHYCRREDADDQRVVLCTKLRITLKEAENRILRDEEIGLGGFFRSNNYHIPSFEDMLALHTDEELNNTIKIAEQCESYDITCKPKLPRYDVPDGKTSIEYLRELCREGWVKLKDRLDFAHHTKEEYGERAKKELTVLEEANLADYFLIVRDIVMYAKSQGQITGVGRGSAAGSLMLYLLGVTQIDPLKYDLLFERFMNASRNTPNHVSFEENPFVK